MKKIKVALIGCGNMGSSHALAYHKLEEFEICAIIDKFEKSRVSLNEKLGGNYPLFDDLKTAIEKTSPDAVAICTYPDSHEEFAMIALDNNCHVFVEKPLATTVEGSERIVKKAKEKNKKVVVGYILRHHPSWIKFIELAKNLGKPLTMRMNLNQQSHGFMWNVHKNLMNSISPIVDCGVHYVDVMCQMTASKPVCVSGIGARLSKEIKEDMYNYGQLQVTFDDGSVGWYEAGWGPMASTKAFFVKDVWGPKGSVCITSKIASSEDNSDNVDSHTKTEMLRLHHSDIDAENNFTKQDEWFSTEDEPDHNELCRREQKFFANAILNDENLDSHLSDAINTMKIVLAADKSIRTKTMVTL